ncbi:MAG: hypothetical protein ACLGHN_16190, partial [Bacteriovoracia bacterium]
MGRIKELMKWINQKLKIFGSTRFYQVKQNNHSEWIMLDELMERNKERHFYQNLLGAQKYENNGTGIRD